MNPKHAVTLSWLPLAAIAAGCASVAIPDSLKPPAGEALALASKADGVQVYECAASKDSPATAARFEWVFKAPEADLFDNKGKRIGRHYAGPTWESLDGSKVSATVAARDDGPDAGAIPWLLLTTKAASGAGAFGHTRSIQRVSTVGGKAPAGGCTQAQSGQQLRVPYKATYYFYVSRS